MWCVVSLSIGFMWGCNNEGALGQDKKDGEEFVSGQVQGALENQVVTQFSAGDSHTAAV